MSAAINTLPAMPLYPSEDEIARAVLGGKRVKEWPSVAAHDERRGLPPVDPVHGGRPWPKVLAFYLKLMDLDPAQPAVETSGRRVLIRDTAPDGVEDFRGEKDAALRGRGADRRRIGARV